jgi:hypothetical protein
MEIRPTYRDWEDENGWKWNGGTSSITEPWVNFRVVCVGAGSRSEISTIYFFQNNNNIKLEYKKHWTRWTKIKVTTKKMNNRWRKWSKMKKFTKGRKKEEWVQRRLSEKNEDKIRVSQHLVFI